MVGASQRRTAMASLAFWAACVCLAGVTAPAQAAHDVETGKAPAIPKIAYIFSRHKWKRTTGLMTRCLRELMKRNRNWIVREVDITTAVKFIHWGVPHAFEKDAFTPVAHPANKAHHDHQDIPTGEVPDGWDAHVDLLKLLVLNSTGVHPL